MVINVVDATNLERNLYLTVQILELDVPVVLALNMTDDLHKDGAKINLDQLSQLLGKYPCGVHLSQSGQRHFRFDRQSRSCGEEKLT